VTGIRVGECGDGRYIVLTIDHATYTPLADGTLDLVLENDEAADLLAQLRGQIGEWAAERNAVRAEFEAHRGDLDDADDLDPLDPKHPDYAEWRWTE
jgi:hypothetical protein